MRVDTGAAFVLLLVCAPLASCDREERAFHGPHVEDAADSGRPSPYNGNAWAISEGKRLYSHFNCAGCHANGGGGIGPALMDDEWIYGFEGADIFETIVDGRPDGMPSFGGKIAEDQVWQIVAYVESMSGHSPIDSLPGRSDRMRARPPENLTDASGRRQTGHR